jgi:hypothetical protein
MPRSECNDTVAHSSRLPYATSTVLLLPACRLVAVGVAVDVDVVVVDAAAAINTATVNTTKRLFLGFSP